MSNQQPVKGHFYAAAYNGDNGDLILGRVESVRTSGHIVLTNLLTGGTSTKKADVLRRRNKRISKSQAQKIAAIFKAKGRAEARKAAVAAPAFRNGRNEPKQLELPMADLKLDKEQLKKDLIALTTKARQDIVVRMSRLDMEIEMALNSFKVRRT